MRSELGKQIEGQAATSQQPTKCANEKNEKGEKTGKSEKSENLSHSTASMDTQTMDELPCFTPRVKDRLTPFLQAIVEAGDTETMQDLLLLSSLNSGLCPARERGSVFITDLAVRFLVEQLK